MEATIQQQQTPQTTPVPAWLQIRFSQLWDKFGHTEFNFEQAKEVLKDSKEVVNVILSRLRRSGWLSVKFDESDFRKRKYMLSDPSQFFRNITPTKVEENANATNKIN